MEAFNIMKAKFITLFLAIFILAFGTSFAQQGEVTLDNVAGAMWHGQPDSIMAGSTYVFSIRFNNNSGLTAKGITNGFTISSPDGATWTSATIDTTGTLGKTQFDLVFASALNVSNGSGVDTVGFGAATLFSPGMANGFNDIVYEITVGPIPGDAGQHLKTICLDSVSYSAQGIWKWAPTGTDLFPSWDGPHCYTVVHEATDVDDELLPDVFSLSQNYPNPFNPTTTINYSLASKSDVNLTIYNVVGQKVQEFTAENKPAGKGFFEWDASNVASGIYFYKISAGDFTATKKMMLLK